MSADTQEAVAVPRPAATVLVVRRTGDRPAILMGQRGANAAFMPSKYVFPGGALDEGDAGIPLVSPLAPACAMRIAQSGDGDLPDALAVAAVRELWEETGLILGERAVWPATVPEDWADFAAEGFLPDAGALRFSSARSRRPAVHAGSMRASLSPMPLRWPLTRMISPARLTNFRICIGSRWTKRRG